MAWNLSEDKNEERVIPPPQKETLFITIKREYTKASLGKNRILFALIFISAMLWIIPLYLIAFIFGIICRLVKKGD